MPNKPYMFTHEGLPDPRGSHHPHAVVAGSMVFVSGAIPQRTPDGLHEGVSRGPGDELIHDVRAQFRSALDGILQILYGVGAQLDSIVEVCVYMTDVNRDFNEFNDEYGEVFSDWLPARTTVEVARLPSNVCLELKVSAVLS